MHLLFLTLSHKSFIAARESEWSTTPFFVNCEGLKASVWMIREARNITSEIHSPAIFNVKTGPIFLPFGSSKPLSIAVFLFTINNITSLKAFLDIHKKQVLYGLPQA